MIGEYGDEYDHDSQDTVAIGIKTKDGIILACDDLYTGNGIKQHVDKIRKINDNMALLSLGNNYDAHRLFEAFQGYDDPSWGIEGKIISVHREYNVVQPMEAKITPLLAFRPSSLVAMKEGNGEYYMASIIFYYQHQNSPSRGYDPNIKGIGNRFPAYRINQYRNPTVIGTYSTGPILLYNQLNRVFEKKNIQWWSLQQYQAIGIAYYIIRQMMEVYVNCGGDVQMAVVDKNGYLKQSDDVMTEAYYKVKDELGLY